MVPVSEERKIWPREIIQNGYRYKAGIPGQVRRAKFKWLLGCHAPCAISLY